MDASANPSQPEPEAREALPLSLLNDYLYCPRRAALKVVEGRREANVHTARGEVVHEHADLPGYEVARGVTLLRALPVWSDRFGLNGKCDIVERHADGALAPVEFKAGRRRQWINDDAQLCAQALCLEEMFAVTIAAGAVFHAESKRRRPVEFTLELRRLTSESIRALHALAAPQAREIVAGKIQNSRNSLLRAARETDSESEGQRLGQAAEALARQIQGLAGQPDLDTIRGAEGLASQAYFSVFSFLLKQQRDEFAFTLRSRRPPRDRINCLLSFIYALVRHDCVAALTSAGLDPFVGFLHADRPNRPSLALDLMEEFRPWLADRLAITLVNRQQAGPSHFKEREGGAVDLTEAGRKVVIQAYQERKKETLAHPLLEQHWRIGQLAFIQARILARRLRGDLAHYVPLAPK